MSGFVQQSILDVVEAKKEDLHHRKQFTAEQIKRKTDLALQLGNAEAAARTGISPATVQTWNHRLFTSNLISEKS